MKSIQEMEMDLQWKEFSIPKRLDIMVFLYQAFCLYTFLQAAFAACCVLSLHGKTLEFWEQKCQFFSTQGVLLYFLPTAAGIRGVSKKTGHFFVPFFAVNFHAFNFKLEEV